MLKVFIVIGLISIAGIACIIYDQAVLVQTEQGELYDVLTSKDSRENLYFITVILDSDYEFTFDTGYFMFDNFDDQSNTAEQLDNLVGKTVSFRFREITGTDYYFKTYELISFEEVI